MNPKPLRILVSPLDWGLGHASRCIPIIRQLTDAGHTVVIGGYGRSLIVLQKEFPLLKYIELRGFSPSFSQSGSLTLHLLLLLPHFIRSIITEHQLLKNVIKLHNFDCIISDNRYGLWNKNTRSILITHQVMVKTPGWLRWTEYFIYRVSKLMIGRFDECWIPDYKDAPGLSGDLSHKYTLPVNAKFIGPLSRFGEPELSTENDSEKTNILAIISGPEPQRSIFEDLLINQLSALKLRSTIVSGKPESDKTAESTSNLTILPYLSASELESLINSAQMVICRSGYSSIMDMHTKCGKALFIPTPGQTEQIYLAQFHQNTGNAMWRRQEELNLEADLAEALKYRGFNTSKTDSSLYAAISGLKKK